MLKNIQKTQYRMLKNIQKTQCRMLRWKGGVAAVTK
jgi:hypothetical protein